MEIPPLSAQLNPEGVGDLPLHRLGDSMLRPEVVGRAFNLPVERPNGVYTVVPDRLCDKVDGSGPGLRLQTMVPVPLWYVL